MRSSTAAAAAGLSTLLCLNLFVPCASADEASEITWPTKGWETSTPEDQGMDSIALAKLVDAVGARRQDSLLIIRHGKIVAEAYYAPYEAGVRHDLRSVTKSVIGSLMGIAVQDGFLNSVDDRIVDLFSDRQIENIDPRKEEMTIQSLLDMTSGLRWKEEHYTPDETIMQMYQAYDHTKFVLDQPMSAKPGSIFYYNGGNPYLLSALITKQTSKSAYDFAKYQLFRLWAFQTSGGDAWTIRASPMGRADCFSNRAIWRNSATFTFETTSGKENRFFPLGGSTGSRREELKRATAVTMRISGGRCQQGTPSWPWAAILNSYWCYPISTLSLS
jgi:CubicO group peptidase (beta-lactamase class C family)